MRSWQLVTGWILIGMCLLLGEGSQAFSTQYRGNTKHPTIPEHCFYEEMGLAVPRNGTLYPTMKGDLCVRVHCREDYVLMVKHCDRMQLADDCHFQVGDSSRPYPDCCPSLVCESMNVI